MLARPSQLSGSGKTGVTSKMPNTGWTGFVPKLALGAAGILFALLVGYFIWLGTTLVTVKQDVAVIKGDVSSLKEARERDTAAKSESNKRRIDALEEEGAGTE